MSTEPLGFAETFHVPVTPLHHFPDRRVIPAGAVLRRYTILVQLGSDRTATQSGSPETEDLFHNLEFLWYW